MGKRANRKKTRESKEVAIRAEIRVGLNGGERFREIARIVSGRYPVGADKVMKMVIQEYGNQVRPGA